MNRQNIATAIALVLLMFFTVSIGYFAHRIDLLDARITNIEFAKEK